MQYGTIQAAIDTCIKLNHWDKALKLSTEHSLNLNVNQLFEKHVNTLLQRGRILDAVQLYRKANRFVDSAELLFEVR